MNNIIDNQFVFNEFMHKNVGFVKSSAVVSKLCERFMPAHSIFSGSMPRE